MHAERADECRPNFFVNTPDILHESLQTGGPAMFAIRATLASTLAPTWGVYSGFELFETQPVRPGSEEYLDSEKYQLRPRDFGAAWAGGRSLEPYITRLNELRRAHPALQQLRDIHFHHTDNDLLIAYSKTDPHRRHGAGHVHAGLVPPTDRHNLALDMPALGPAGTTGSGCATRWPAGRTTGASTTSCGSSRGATSRISHRSQLPPSDACPVDQRRSEKQGGDPQVG